jgi:hypothetical protein
MNFIMIVLTVNAALTRRFRRVAVERLVGLLISSKYLFTLSCRFLMIQTGEYRFHSDPIAYIVQ